MAAEVLEMMSLRLTEESDVAALDALVGRFGSPSRVEAVREAIRRVAAEAPMPADVMLWYKGKDGVAARLFATEMHQGPMTALAALERAVALEKRGFAVRAEQMPELPARLRPHADAEELCQACGCAADDHDESCKRGAR